MRDIKFRVWSTKYKQFWKFGVGDTFVFKKDERPDQYTGLRDQRGKEIYEGDIVQYEDIWSIPSKMKRDVVTLDTFRFWLKDESFGYEGEQLVSPQESEVIGNIYENPDLLKETK